MTNPFNSYQLEQVIHDERQIREKGELEQGKTYRAFHRPIGEKTPTPQEMFKVQKVEGGWIHILKADRDGNYTIPAEIALTSMGLMPHTEPAVVGKWNPCNYIMPVDEEGSPID